jgi:hypothetical protein
MLARWGAPLNLLETRHTYDMIDQTMKILNIARKRRKLNTLERYPIYDLSKKKNYK